LAATIQSTRSYLVLAAEQKRRFAGATIVEQ